METIASRKDFDIQWFSGQGPGGQHRNKHQNCCRITHLSTGMRETGQSHRDRSSNQRDAFRRLARRVVAAYLAKEERERQPVTETIRTYHEARNEVRDHASNHRMRYDEVVGKRNLGPMIDARRAYAARELG